MLDLILSAGGGLALLVAVTFHHLQLWSVSPPFLGLLGGILLGPRVFDVVAFSDPIPVLTSASRLLLAVALMAIALRFPIRVVRTQMGPVLLLILVVLPTMATVVAASAAWTLGLPVGVALALGAALSPTDPVLASGILSGEEARRDIHDRDRQLLSLESGANDGLALPLVGVAVAVALGQSVTGSLARSLYEVLGAAAVGLAMGAGAGRLLAWAKSHREIGASGHALFPLVLAACALGTSGLLGVDGLLTVFATGLAHNRFLTGGDREVEVGIDESLNQFLVVPFFLLFGAALPWSSWGDLGLPAILLVAAALFVRRLPIVLVLRRSLHRNWSAATWLGWFGPMGVAAIYYAGQVHEQGVTDPRLWAAGTLVVATSTVVHGLTAGPGRLAYRAASIRVENGSHDASGG